jgi:hypothetical protein
MKSSSRLLIAGAMALMILAPAAMAQTPEVSPFPVTEPTEISGTVLQPGNYMIKMLPSFSNKNQVQITSVDGETIYATVLTVPHQLEPNEEMPNTMFVYFPAGEGQPRALRTWFAPDPVTQGGHDFVYEETRAKQLARLANTRVVSYEGQVADLGTTELHVVTPAATVETYTYTPPPAQITTTTETEPVQIAESRPMELPSTAGSVPMIALAGLLAIGGAVALRAAR